MSSRLGGMAFGACPALSGQLNKEFVGFRPSNPVDSLSKPQCQNSLSLKRSSKKTPGACFFVFAAEASVDVSRGPVLFTSPVSNFGARCRYIVYAKGLEDQVAIESPAAFGGLKSPGFLKINPLGKVPAMVVEGGLCFIESDVIVNYLLDRYVSMGPGFRPATPELRAFSAMITRLHDVYMTPHQACMYRDMELSARQKDFASLKQYLDVIEGWLASSRHLRSDQPLLAGPNMSSADIALFPTFAFYTYLLPKYWGWADVFQGRPLLREWWSAVQEEAHVPRVLEEIQSGFEVWEQQGRFENLTNDHS